MPLLVPAAARALSVFEIFSQEKRELSNGELARLLELPESSCSDLVSTLVDCGYLTRIAGTRRVYPSGRLLEVAEGIRLEDVVLRRLQEGAQKLRDATGESTLCGKIENGVVKVLVFCEGRFELRYNSARSEKIALHASALGKAILSIEPVAYATQQLQLKPQRRLASGTLTDLDMLLQQIRKFRKQGYALVENEGGEDLAALSIAGPIAATSFAISIAGPVGRLRMHFDEYLGRVQDVARELFDPGRGLWPAPRVKRQQ